MQWHAKDNNLQEPSHMCPSFMHFLSPQWINVPFEAVVLHGAHRSSSVWSKQSTTPSQTYFMGMQRFLSHENSSHAGFRVLHSFISLPPTHSSGSGESEKSLQCKYSGSSKPKTSKKNAQRLIVSRHKLRHGGTGLPFELHLGTNKEQRYNGTTSKHCTSTRASNCSSSTWLSSWPKWPM